MFTGNDINSYRMMKGCSEKDREGGRLSEKESAPLFTTSFYTSCVLDRELLIGMPSFAVKIANKEMTSCFFYIKKKLK